MTATDLLNRITIPPDWESTSIFADAADDCGPCDWLADSTELARLRDADTVCTVQAKRVWIGPIEPIRGTTSGV